MKNLWNAEPVAVAGAVRVLVVATIGLALVFGWISWDDAEVGAVMTVYGALEGLVAVLTRRKVAPVEP